MSNQITGNIIIYPHHSQYDTNGLIANAHAIVNPRGKGIYATDEAPDAMDALLDDGKKYNDDGRKERRKKWKECVYGAVNSDYISGVILHSETLFDFKLASLLSNKGVIPGIRSNGELVPIPRSPDEFMVQGIDGLLSDLQAAHAAGARFSKWRTPFACGPAGSTLPSTLALEIGAETLAQFAAISQQAGLVPIVEPDVDFSKDADLTRSAEVHEAIICKIYERMRAHGVLLEGSLIKPSFVQPGLKHPSRATVTSGEIALATATVISRSVPSAVPGVLFLSGGLPSDTAIRHLAAINALALSSPPNSNFTRLPALTFSYGRALQGESLKRWVEGNEEAAKASLEECSKACWHAAKGELRLREEAQ